MKYSIVILLFLIACGSNNSVHKESSKGESNSGIPSLESWSNEFLMYRNHEDLAYFNDHENFISKYFSVKYEEKIIVATTLIEVGCIDSIVGKIEVSNDTIYLIRDVIMTDDRFCSELHKFEFIINNPENKRYRVISSK